MTPWTLSLVLLGVGVLCYGVAGSQLADGARHSSGPLRSGRWWTGTGLQGCGFVLTLLSRQWLPLLLVQGAVVAALGVTAVLQHVFGRRRLGPADTLAIAAIVAGLVLVGLASRPSGTPAISTGQLTALAVLTVALAAALVVTRHPVVHGLVSGTGFAVGAIAGRLLMGRPDASWSPLSWPAPAWGAAALVVAGLAVGQVALTAGLARSAAVSVLGLMYLASTAVPALAGWLVLGETPRPGTGAVLGLGLAAAAAGCGWLIRTERHPVPVG